MKKSLLFSACLTYAMMAPAAVSAENLQEAVQKAVTTHPSVERAEIGTDIAKEDIKEQRSGFFPQVNASVSGGRLYGDNATSRGLSVTRGAGYSWLWEGNAAINQMVFDWNQTSDRVESAAAQRMAALHDFEDIKQSIAFEAVKAYIALYEAQILYSAAEKHLNAMKDYRSRITKLMEGGGADEAEASRARDLVLAAQNIKANLKGQLKAAEAGYKEMMGALSQDDLAPPPMPFAMENDADIEALIAKIQAHHPQVESLNEQIEALGFTAEAESKEPLPKLNSEFSYTKRDQRDLIGGESTDARAMLRLNWTLDTGGAQFARAERARLEQEELYAQREEIRRALERNLRVALAGFEIAREQRDILKGRYDELVKTLATYKQQFEAAKKKLLEVAQTENQVFNAQNSYLAAEFDLLNAAYGFIASQGNLTDAIDILALMEEAAAEAAGHSPKKAMQLSEITPYSIRGENRPPYRKLIKVKRQGPPLPDRVKDTSEKAAKSETRGGPADDFEGQVESHMNAQAARAEAEFAEEFAAQRMEEQERLASQSVKHAQNAAREEAEVAAIKGHNLSDISAKNDTAAVADAAPASTPQPVNDGTEDISLAALESAEKTYITDVEMAEVVPAPAATGAELQTALDSDFEGALHSFVTDVTFDEMEVYRVFENENDMAADVRVVEEMAVPPAMPDDAQDNMIEPAADPQMRDPYKDKAQSLDFVPFSIHTRATDRSGN